MVNQSSGILVFAGILVILAIIAVGIFAIGLTRRTNQRRQTDATIGKGNIPRDPTISKRADDVEDTVGNFSRTVTDKQDTSNNATK